ncbi:hypothetical protein [Desertivirga brevis]|uniref:hypothetical protein n=1 Tax=Desertivirga brevis TaxID=2810310 RepID=UPI001A96F999|nr:hypothetical protein [Pedobacter sp. SYSU D00873]
MYTPEEKSFITKGEPIDPEPIPGEPNVPESEEVESPDNNKELLPEDDDFDADYGDLDGAQENDILPHLGQQKENLE